MLRPSIFGESLFDDFFDDFFTFGDKEMQSAEKKLYGHHAGNMMKTDVQEHNDHYEVAIDLPGFKKDELTLELKDGYLTISAAKGLDKDQKEEKSGKYIRRERYAGEMRRSFYVGEEIKQEEVHAKYENGVLKLSFPKHEKASVEANKNKIAIEG